MDWLIYRTIDSDYRYQLVFLITNPIIVLKHYMYIIVKSAINCCHRMGLVWHWDLKCSPVLSSEEYSIIRTCTVVRYSPDRLFVNVKRLCDSYLFFVEHTYFWHARLQLRSHVFLSIAGVLLWKPSLLILLRSSSPWIFFRKTQSLTNPKEKVLGYNGRGE